MIAEKGKRAAYTLQYTLEAVRLVQGGQACAVTAKVLGIPKQTLENWVRQAAKCHLQLIYPGCQNPKLNWRPWMMDDSLLIGHTEKLLG